MMVRRGETFTRYINVINEVVETKGDAEAEILLTQATRDGIAN
jgi:hypothetical protein